MAERLGHLELPLFPENYERQKPQTYARITPRPAEEKAGYFEVQIEHLASIQQAHQRDKARYSEFLDPNLIFKLEITQPLVEDSLREHLRRMDITVLAPAPQKMGLWVVFAEDEEAVKFRRKLQLYAEQDRYGFFSALGELVEIPVEDKIGERLGERALGPDEIAYLDVEIWRMEDERLERFVNGLGDLISARGGRVTDKLIKRSFCLLRIQGSAEIVNEILPLREIALVDRPPKPYIQYGALSSPLGEVNVGPPPPSNATAIAVVDSGIRSGHPLLQNAVGDEIAVGTWHTARIREGQPVDDVGHGTKVAGVALYGDLKACIESGEFLPEVWILSAKVMFREQNPVTGEIEAKYDEEELFEHQLDDAVRRLTTAYPNCRVVNLSLGDEYRCMFGDRRQFNLAALVDELSKELGVVFVISAGNLSDFDSRGFPDTYPAYLLEEKEDVKIIDPASAALGITVGSITQAYGPSDRLPMDLLFSPADTGHPSPFTRVGPGYKGMIKPEVVEEGGNIILDRWTSLPDIGGKLVTLNPNWITDGRLFTVDHGTSFSAPRVSHYVAQLFNRYPDYSHNLVKALLISSAQIPLDRPAPLSEISLDSSDAVHLLNVYGYGRPNVERASFSARQRALLLKEKSIALDSIDVYYFYLPNEFMGVQGLRRLAVTLVYDPPVNRNRIDYMGCSMEFHLFRNMEVAEVAAAYRPMRGVPDDEIVPEQLRVSEIRLHPGVNLRKRGVHQKGIIEYARRPRIVTDKPLVLAVICRDRWIGREDYLQSYAILVTVEHSGNIDLFNLVRARNQERVRVALK